MVDVVILRRSVFRRALHKHGADSERGSLKKAPEFSLKRGRGGGPGTQKSKILCTKNSQINISVCKISFFPTVKSGSRGGGLDPTPPPIPGRR